MFQSLENYAQIINYANAATVTCLIKRNYANSGRMTILHKMFIFITFPKFMWITYHNFIKILYLFKAQMKFCDQRSFSIVVNMTSTCQSEV